MNNELLEKAYQAIDKIFPCEKGIIVPLEKMKETMIRPEHKTEEHPFLIRICGQSGSGKSSQILPYIEETLKGTPYIRFGARFFAPFHPDYENLKKTPSLAREKTNGFALIALFEFYRFCIERRLNVLIDMTLLEPEIDLYMMQLAKENGYRIQMHMLCVPKKISNTFIHKRELETGRKVYKASADYFFQSLPRSLKALTHEKIFENSDKIYLWSHQQKVPIFKSKIQNPKLLSVLRKRQSKAYYALKPLRKTIKKVTLERIVKEFI